MKLVTTRRTDTENREDVSALYLISKWGLFQIQNKTYFRKG